MPYHILAFDSGIGGLGIVQSLLTQSKEIPLKFSIDYLADNLVFPYGEQKDDFLIERIIHLIGQAIQTIKPDLVIIACNTASTIALDILRQHYPSMPFVGCVPPLRWAARISKSKTIGLLATRATIKRPYLQSLKEKFASDCELIAYGSPILAQLAEDFFRYQTYNIHQIQQELNHLFQSPNSEEIDTICIGCTHYTFILDILRQHSSSTIKWLDPAPAVAKHTIDLLTAKNIPPSQSIKNNQFYCTAPIQQDQSLLQRIKPMGYNQILHFQ